MKQKNSVMRLLRQALVGTFTAGAGFLFLSMAGCAHDYYPWTNRSWNSSEHRAPSPRAETATRPLEDICQDRRERETVALYRTFLEPDYDWQAPSPEVEARRRRWCQEYVDQYERRCLANE